MAPPPPATQLSGMPYLFLLLVALALQLALMAPAKSQESWTTAEGLASACESRDPGARNLCLGILFGALQTVDIYRDLRVDGDPVLREDGRLVCPPNRLALNDVREEFIRWVADNRAAREMPSGRAVFSALADMFPCRRAFRPDRRGGVFDDDRDDRFPGIPRIGL